ncbi:MAG: ATP-binding cassette domain-containing protein, partial [Bacillota bacterium]|nr:ATP-binding cassette domain-containing protein [Bacillota bacterium]
SGIGKSTLTRLLLGVFKLNTGEITLVLNSGDEIPVDKNTRKLFAYVPQGNYLLSGTIRENLAYLKPDASDDEIIKAAKIGCADTFIKALPNGLDTAIGEKGLGLSEGQVQRLAITRAIVGDAPILIFDEATSAIDEATEAELLNNIKNMKDKTCIIVSHKKASLAVCNREIKIIDKKIFASEISHEY